MGMRLRLLFAAGVLVFVSGCSSCVDERPPDAEIVNPEPDADALDTGNDTDDAGDLPDDSAVDTDPDTDSDADATGDVEDDATAPDGGDTADDADAGPVCGNGNVESGEACDDGNTSDGDYCSGDCQTVTGRCGDGTLQSNESCDDGQISSNCDTYQDGGDGTCQPPGQCSSGYVYDGSKCVSKTRKDHVHISITNTCKLSVQPKNVTIKNGRSTRVTYHNHSRSYPTDITYAGGGGGFRKLKPGRSWTSPIDWCTNKTRPYTVQVEITVHGFTLNDSRCPGHKFEIRCR